MAEHAAEWVGEDAFLAFTLGREERWELVYGVPCMMAGAGRQHDRIVVNTLSLLNARLAGRACEPFTADTFVRIPAGNYRMPDAGVECGQPGLADRVAAQPALVVEVLSPSTRYFDLFAKLDEYKSVPSIVHILLIDADLPQATLWSRGKEGLWTNETIIGRDAVLSLPALDLVLPMAELYARVEFPARPHLFP